MLHTTLAVATGGAFGALLRYWASHGIHTLAGRGFPFGTLSVNVLGSLVMGGVYVLFFERQDMDLPDVWHSAVAAGCLGAFTTFSTFSLETLLLLRNGDHSQAVVSVFLNVGLCLAGCWMGILLARQI